MPTKEFENQYFIICIMIAKGQLISKGLFGILNSPKKRAKKFVFTSMIPQVDFFPFVFVRN